MVIFLDILKFFIVLIYIFFVLDSVLNFKYEFDDGNLWWLDLVYMAYAGINFVLIVKVFH